MIASHLAGPAVLLSLAACHPEAYVVNAAPDPIAAVKAAAADFDRAQLRGDRAAIERYLASDFVFVRGAGVVADRNAFIAAFTGPKTRLEPFVVEHPIAIRLADSAVIIGGEVTLKGTDNGEPFSEHFRFSDIFQWRDDRWQVVYTQVTMVK
jgi:ketosteroid isomerase-like protein